MDVLSDYLRGSLNAALMTEKLACDEDGRNTCDVKKDSNSCRWMERKRKTEEKMNSLFETGHERGD